MAAITEETVRCIEEAFARGDPGGFPLTSWEKVQLARAWSEAEAARVPLSRELMQSYGAEAHEATFKGFAESSMAPKVDRFTERVYDMGFEAGWRIREQLSLHSPVNDAERASPAQTSVSMPMGLSSQQAGYLKVAVDLLREVVPPLEVSAAVIESEDGGEAIETLISKVKEYVEHFDRAQQRIQSQGQDSVTENSRTSEAAEGTPVSNEPNEMKTGAGE